MSHGSHSTTNDVRPHRHEPTEHERNSAFGFKVEHLPFPGPLRHPTPQKQLQMSWSPGLESSNRSRGLVVTSKCFDFFYKSKHLRITRRTYKQRVTPVERMTNALTTRTRLEGLLSHNVISVASSCENKAFAIRPPSHGMPGSGADHILLITG